VTQAQEVYYFGAAGPVRDPGTERADLANA
jgi:hypothetical protein